MCDRKVGEVLIVALALHLGACLQTETEGFTFCDPYAAKPCPTGWICKPQSCPSDWWCFRRQLGDPERIDPGCFIDGHCAPTSCETEWTCPADCNTVCDPHDGGVVVAEYLASSYHLASQQEFQFGEQNWPLDLDDDGRKEYRFGTAVVWMFEGLDILLPNEVLHSWVEQGSLLVALRVVQGAADASGDGTMVQVLPAQVHEHPPTFDGTDVVRIASDATTEIALCDAAPPSPAMRFVSSNSSGPLRLPIPHFGMGYTATLELHRAQIEVWIDTEGQWREAYLGGGLRPQDVWTLLYPPMVAMLNATIAADPEGRTARLIAQHYDGNCVVRDEIPGCDGGDPFQQACSQLEEPPVITVTEVKCNALAAAASRPDLDSDGDGVDELISFGVFLPLVPATLLD